MMLNWALGGAPYVGCDIGGFSPATNTELLVRWYQAGVFFPTMRVHSTIGVTPHFPWLWGEEAAEAMREALDLRYRLVPYHYSLAHSLFKEKKLMMRPLVMDYPEDKNVTSMTTQWMDGDLLVAPVLQENSQKDIYLPPGTWLPFQGGAWDAWVGQAVKGGRHRGPQHITGAVPMRGLPVFARAGAVVPLAPAGMQYTGALPGAPLEVQVYAGADGYFDMVEDDGETTAYESGDVHVTRFRWDDASCTFGWSGIGPVKSRKFAELQVRILLGEDTAFSPKLPFSGSSGSFTLHMWKVVSEVDVRVRETKDLDAKVLNMLEPGKTIRGTVEGGWLRLADEPGFIILKIGGSTLIEPLCRQTKERPAQAQPDLQAFDIAKYGPTTSVASGHNQTLTATRDAWVPEKMLPMLPERNRLFGVGLSFGVASVALVAGLVVAVARPCAASDPSSLSLVSRSGPAHKGVELGGPYSPLETAKPAAPGVGSTMDC